MQAVADVLTPRQVAAAMEKQYNIPISFGPNGGISLSAFYKSEDAFKGPMEDLWLNMKFFYEYSTCRGDPRDAQKLIAAEGLTLASLEDVSKDLHAAGAFNL